MFVFYEMWVSVIFLILGRTAIAAIEEGPMEHFKTFHECINNISSNSGALGCSQSEACLQAMFNASEPHLKSNIEIVKLEIQHSLDNLKHSCSAMFTEALQKNVHCQTEQIASCLKDAEIIKGDMCGQIKNMSDCLRPVNSKCFNRIFASILRSISRGIWDNHKCMSTADADEIWIKDLEVNESLEIHDFQNTLVSDMLARDLDHNSSQTNLSSPKSRQGNPVTLLHDLSLENVTTEESTTKFPNSAKMKHCNYISLLLPMLTFLIL